MTSLTACPNHYICVPRYNHWQSDPFSRAGYGGPQEGQSAENAIASRYDLIVDAACPSCTEKRTPFGNTDAKLVDQDDVKAMRFEGIAGPTHSTQPVFSWTGDWARFPHYGQNTTMGFGWVNLSAAA